MIRSLLAARTAAPLAPVRRVCFSSVAAAPSDRPLSKTEEVSTQLFRALVCLLCFGVVIRLFGRVLCSSSGSRKSTARTTTTPSQSCLSAALVGWSLLCCCWKWRLTVPSPPAGVFVWDVEGKRYFDFLSAYSAVNQVRLQAAAPPYAVH